MPDRPTVQQAEHVLLSAARILRVAEAGERQLDKHLALRFNVLDYLRDDEMGLSRIMADLLDPRAGHGQGALFLKTLLRGLAERERERERTPGLESTLREMCTAVDGPAPHILVEKERRIDGDRRIDVSIEIDGRRCIAIENKPYSDDQPDQVKDYLAFLRQEYADRFLLLYVSAGRRSAFRLKRDEGRPQDARRPFLGHAILRQRSRRRIAKRRGAMQFLFDRRLGGRLPSALRCRQTKMVSARFQEPRSTNFRRKRSDARPGQAETHQSASGKFRAPKSGRGHHCFLA